VSARLHRDAAAPRQPAPRAVRCPGGRGVGPIAHPGRREIARRRGSRPGRVRAPASSDPTGRTSGTPPVPSSSGADLLMHSAIVSARPPVVFCRDGSAWGVFEVEPSAYAFVSDADRADLLARTAGAFWSAETELHLLGLTRQIDEA